jgi:hypothetical protein
VVKPKPTPITPVVRPEPAPPKPEPTPAPTPAPKPQATVKFEVINPVNQRYRGGSLYDKIMSRLERPFTQGSRATQAHETVHGINNKYRNQLFYKLMGQKNPRANDSMALFVSPDKIFYSFKPATTKAEIARFVPKSLQFTTKYPLYVTNPNKMHQGAYDIFDEWTAYIVDAEVAMEDQKNGISLNGEVGQASGVLELGIYSTATLMATKEIEPELRPFFDFIYEKADKVFKEGRKALPFSDQEKLLHLLRNSPDAQPMRDYLKKNFKGAFLND